MSLAGKGSLKDKAQAGDGLSELFGLNLIEMGDARSITAPKRRTKAVGARSRQEAGAVPDTIEKSEKPASQKMPKGTTKKAAKKPVKTRTEDTAAGKTDKPEKTKAKRTFEGPAKKAVKNPARTRAKPIAAGRRKMAYTTPPEQGKRNTN